MIKTAVKQLETSILPGVTTRPLPIMPGLVVPEPRIIRPAKTRRTLPAVWMRAGTSKGLYLHRHDLPANPKDWEPIITRVMGSSDADPRQLNGIGGATSTTSKVAVVSPSKRPGVDVDYTFVQVAISSPKLDFTGNCGNIASGVGPFALDEGLVPVAPDQHEVQVRIFNTNTNSVMVETVQVDDDGHFQEDGDCALPGLHSTGSRVKMTFARPAGAMTGKLLPTGNTTDIILVQSAPSLAPVPVKVSLVDAANPFVLVDATNLPAFYDEDGPAAPTSISFIESVRCQAAVSMGLATSVEMAALTRGTPKIAVLREPEHQEGLPYADIQCLSYSMGKIHGSLQLTGAVCLASAASAPGTVAHTIRIRSIAKRSSPKVLSSAINRRRVTLRHPGGDMDVDVCLGKDMEVEDVTVFRTARRLMEGRVYYLA